MSNDPPTGLCDNRLRQGNRLQPVAGAGPGFAPITGARSAQPVPHVPRAAPRPLSCLWWCASSGQRAGWRVRRD